MSQPDQVAVRQRGYAQKSRDKLREINQCINGPRKPGETVGIKGVVHGEVVSGGKCQRCIDVHKGASPS